MAAADEQARNALDGYLDRAFRGGPAGQSEGGLDPTLAATVRRFTALEDVPPPEPAFADRLWNDLMRNEAPARVISPARSLVPSAKKRTSTGSDASWPTAIRSTLRRWPIAQIATAALVVLTLVSGFVAFEMGRSRSRGDRPGDITTETLVEVTLPVDAALAGPDSVFSFTRYQLDPGDSLFFPPLVPQPRALIVFVEAGTMTVPGADNLEIVRSAPEGMSRLREALPPGAEATLVAGDAFVYAPISIDGEIRPLSNMGSTPLLILTGEWYEQTPTYIPSAEAFAWFYENVKWPSPSQPVQISLQRFTLAPDTSLPPEELVGLQIYSVEQGTLESTVDPPATDAGAQSKSRTYRKALTFYRAAREVPLKSPLIRSMAAEYPPGSVQTITNVGDEPLVYLVMSIEPAGTATADP